MRQGVDAGSTAGALKATGGVKRWRADLLPIYAGSVVIVAFVAAGLFGERIAPHDPDQQALMERLLPPAWEEGGSTRHLLGTDGLGRDMLSRIIAGARISLIVVAASIPVSMALGVTLGLLASWRGGLVESATMRLVEVQLAFPAILLAAFLAAVFGPSLQNVVIVLASTRWAAYARVSRAESLSLRERDFIVAARASGATEGRILLRHVLPGLLNSIVVLATLDIAVVVIAEASLSFLGLGVEAGTTSWGAMIADGRNYLAIAWWLCTVPGIALLVLALAANLLGDWLRDRLDPKLRHNR